MTEEDQIQMAIVEYLHLRKQLFYHVPNQSRATAAWRRKMKDMGLLAGVPDIALVLADGRAAYMEVKSPTGRLSAAQKAFRDAAVNLGALWAEVRSVNDAATALELWGTATMSEGDVHDIELSANLELIPGDWEASFNVRDFIEKVLTANSCVKVVGKGVGPESADLDINIDGAPFNVEIRPRSMSSSPHDPKHIDEQHRS